MESNTIQEGRDYGIQLRLSESEPIVRVTVLERVGRKGKIKVRHVSDPHAGLEEYVSSRNVVVLWKDVRRFERDEERTRRIGELSAGIDNASVTAVNAILGDSGEPSAGLRSRSGSNYLEMPLEEVRRIAGRADLSDSAEELHPAAFVNLRGDLLLPYEAAEELASRPSCA